VNFEQFLQPLGELGPASLTALAITFLGGMLASAVCPCTLPMGVGVAGLAGASEVKLRWGGLQIAGAFFAGIVVCLTVLGAVAGRVGGLVTESFGRSWALTMATASFVAALVALWWPRMKINALLAWRRPGVMGAFSYGAVFSLGTAVAPLLLLLTIAAAQGTNYGFLLAFVFGLGRGLPFLLAGIAGSAITGLTRLGSWSRAIQIVSSVALLLVSAYYVNVFVELR
jgi:cytochrome c-type biogenesis protein